MILTPEIEKKNNVFIATPMLGDFSDSYLKVREKEGRVYSDDIVASLPYLASSHPQYEEWKKRQKTTHRFLNYLKRKNINNLLEIGCGNGWFSGQCAQHAKSVAGVDINFPELEQAARVFQNGKLTFLYWNLFTPSPFTQSFDVIVLNASVQYFEDFDLLIKHLTQLLTHTGEIHILDSPFYHKEEVSAAKKRTEDYYQAKGIGEMSAFYHHHSKDVIRNFDTLFEPSKSRLVRFLKPDSPFGWYRKVVN